MIARNCHIRIVTNDGGIISRHRSMPAARRAFTWTLNNGYEHLGLRRGLEVRMFADGHAYLSGAVR